MGLKAFFEVDYVVCLLAKRKLTSLKCEEKCSSVEKFLCSSHVLGSKLLMSQGTSLVSLNHLADLVKTDKDDNIFPRQSQTKWCVGFPTKFVLTSDITLVE